jgi:hypothetical protein
MVSGRKSFFCILNGWLEKSFPNNGELSRTQEKPHYYDESKQIKPDVSTNESATSAKPIEGSRVQVKTEDIKQYIIIGYCLVIMTMALYVPWRVVKYVNETSINFSMGYSFLFSSPMPSIASIDYGLVILEIIAITAIAIILYTLRDRLSVLINHILNLDRR